MRLNGQELYLPKTKMNVINIDHVKRTKLEDDWRKCKAFHILYNTESVGAFQNRNM